MKKFLTLFAALSLTLTPTACGSQSAADGDTAAKGDDIPDSVTLLTTVWDNLDDDMKFPAVGGDYETSTDAVPGAVDISDPEMLDNLLALPSDAAPLIDDAASLYHMMNANTFTAGAFRVTNADDVSTVADALHENLQNRRWMCGFPDKMVILTADNYVVSLFGAEDLTDAFRDTMETSYSSAAVAYDEPIE